MWVLVKKMTKRQHCAVLLSIEGIDASGKTTLVDTILKHYEDKGLKVAIFRFPTRDTPIGKLIDQVLRKEVTLPSETLQFLFSANRSEMQEQIHKTCHTHDLVLFDRYLDSAVAYAVAQNMSGDWIRTLDKSCIAPDGCIFLHINPENATFRQKERQKSSANKAELYDKTKFQTLVHKAYCKCYPLDTTASHVQSWATPKIYPHLLVQHINAEESKNSVFLNAIEFLEKLLKEKQS